MKQARSYDKKFNVQAVKLAKETIKCKSKCNTKQKSVAITSAQREKIYMQSVAIKNAQEVQ